MNRKIWILLLVLPVVLFGCRGQVSTPVQFQKVPDVHPALAMTSAIAVMETATSANPCADFSCATITPAPSPTVESSPSPALLAAAQSAPFQDCHSTPGLVKCAPDAAPLGGEFTFVDGEAKRVVALDLRSGAGWQAPLPVVEGNLQVQYLDWSPNGDRLLVNVEPDQYIVYDQAGKQADAFTNPIFVPQWQPGGRLARDGSVDGPQGQVARLELTGDTGWALHVAAKPGVKEQVMPVGGPSGEEFQLRAWIPGLNKVLAQGYYSGGSAMLIGGRLVTIDPFGGAIQNWNVPAPLAKRGVFAWNPKTPSLLAFRQSGLLVMMARTIGLLDFSAGKLRSPLPESVNVTDLLWTPDGKQLVFSATIMEDAPDSVKKTFSGPGVYELDPQSGKVTLLFGSPKGAFDGFLNWMADGQTLIYARAVEQPGSLPTLNLVELHARLTGQPPAPNAPDRLLVNGIAFYGSTTDDQFWQNFLAFRQISP